MNQVKAFVNIVALFSEEEMHSIKREYSYKERVVESLNGSLFTEHNLDGSADSNLSIGMNVSKSGVLGPFNSAADFSDNYIQQISDKAEDKRSIKFKSKLREFDRRYERENNSKLDNGMYVKNLNNGTMMTEVKKEKAEKKQKSAIRSIISLFYLINRCGDIRGNGKNGI